MTKTEDRDAVRRQLLSLATLTREELTEKWKDLFGRTPPNYGTLFMRTQCFAVKSADNWFCRSLNRIVCVLADSRYLVAGSHCKKNFCRTRRQSYN